MITRQQVEYLCMYQSGATMKEIAEKYKVNTSTVSRVISRARKIRCPFAADCTRCPLSDCAIKDEYSYLMNTVEEMPNI